MIQAAYNLNKPLTMTTCDAKVSSQSYITVDSPAVVVETLKRVCIICHFSMISFFYWMSTTYSFSLSPQREDQNDVYVLRLFESFGARLSCEITISLPLYNARL